MCVLTALVGLNYMAICRHYPDGGGVYASVRHRSEIISIVGAFLLVADYIVTASISSLSAFQYLGVPHPEKFAAAAILVIGALNYFGPRHTGGLAFLIAVPTVLGLAMHALGGLQINRDQVDAPGHPGVRDYMLRYMGEVFVGNFLGPTMGHIMAWLISIVFCFLLLSAVNTAIVALIGTSFLMSR